MGRKRVKLEDEKEDRINDLPDPIIHHILSFLPSTLEAIRTGILSKRWKNQWTQVPVLIFNCFTSSGKSIENFLQNVDNTLILHDCLKIKKFHLEYYNYSSVKDPQLTSTIRFATAKHVEDLSLSLPQIPPLYMLPEFPLNKASLVKLRITGCTFPPPKGKENNWLCLTTLSLKCCALTDQVIAHVLLSGCPLLESLEVASCYGFREIVIASKSLKKFVLEGAYMCYIYRLQISCPKLEELSLKEIYTNVPRLIPQAIENILSVSLLLKSIDLFDCGRMLDQFVIASKSLKRLALGGHKNSDVFEIEISCPNLEELKMFGYLEVKTAKLDLPSSLCAIIDFDHVGELQTTKSLIMELLQQLHHVNELKIGCDQFIEILSTIKTRPLFSLVLNIKCLTLNSPRYQKHHCGIARLLRISPVLEKLVINVQRFKCSYKLRNNYWSSNEIVFDCLVAHLKIIRIVGFGFTERDAKCQHLLNFVQFLLKHAKVLEKMVVVVKDDGKGSPLQVCQELLSFPRCSKNAVIEVVGELHKWLLINIFSNLLNEETEDAWEVFRQFQVRNGVSMAMQS